VFSLYPVPGALDVLVAPEFLEVGRMIELGFVAPSRTTVVCSTHRLYSIHEKIATGHAVYPARELEAAARASSRALIAFDASVPDRNAAPGRCRERRCPRRGLPGGDQRKGVGVAAVSGPRSGWPARQAATGSPAEATRLQMTPAGCGGRRGTPEALRPTVSVALARLSTPGWPARTPRGLRLVARAHPRRCRAGACRPPAVWMTTRMIRVGSSDTARPHHADPGGVRARDAEIVVTDYPAESLSLRHPAVPARRALRPLLTALAPWPATLGQHVRRRRHSSASA
jgi:hypothetical protein